MYCGKGLFLTKGEKKLVGVLKQFIKLENI